MLVQTLSHWNSHRARYGFARAEEADSDGPGAANYFGEHLLCRDSHGVSGLGH